MFNVVRYFLSSHGRLPRASWAFRTLLLALLTTALGELVLKFSNSLYCLLLLLFFLGACQLAIRRLHDVGASGITMYWLLIPIIGPLYVFAKLLKAGTLSENRFGHSPLAQIDYLQVDTTAKSSHILSQTVNDVTHLNSIPVLGRIAPQHMRELQTLVTESSLPLSIGGGHFSMGGQTSSSGTLHIDMRLLNHIIAFDKLNKTIRVEAGIRWCDIQKYIDPHGLSVKIMQTYANFTVGGTLSVNAHGRYMGLGPVILSVRNIELLLVNGESVTASPASHADLFYAAIGGYGAIGIITKVELELVENLRLERKQRKMPAKDYLSWFNANVRQQQDVVFHNADLYPMHFSKLRAISWVKTEKPVTTRHRLQHLRRTYPLELYFLWAFTETPFGKFRREHIIDPLVYLFKKVHWRNYEAGYDARELEPLIRKHSTYVLQEYFVPAARLPEFIIKISTILNQYKVNVLNISIRHALADSGSLMAWARGETFAFVLYYKQDTHPLAQNQVSIWTRAIIEAALTCEGTYYLPYQIHATTSQFHHAYPRAKELFALKQQLDPNYRLRNALWDHYYLPTIGKEPDLNHRSLFHRVYDQSASADRFYSFLQNIFNIYPEDRFHLLIMDAVKQYEDDENIYQHIQRALPSIQPALSLFRFALPSLIKQKKEMGLQTAQLLSNKSLRDYVEIGTTGRYVKAMQKHLNLSGKVTLVNEIAPGNTPVDIVERGQLYKIGAFVPLNNYAPIDLPSHSADLVSCFIGLHHMAPENLIPFLKSVADILRPGGYFVLRDHDVKDKEMNDFVSLAHCVFNVGLNETWATNLKELRHFASADEWIQLVESVGFQHTGAKLLQSGDPSNNVLMAFQKI